MLFGFAGKALPSLTEQNWSHAQELAATLRTSTIFSIAFFPFWFEKCLLYLLLLLFLVVFFYPWLYWWCLTLFRKSSFFTLCKAVDVHSLCVAFAILDFIWIFAVYFSFFPSFFQMTQSWFSLLEKVYNEFESLVVWKANQILPCSDALHEYFEGNSVSFQWSSSRMKRDWKIQVCFSYKREFLL